MKTLTRLEIATDGATPTPSKLTPAPQELPHPTLADAVALASAAVLELDVDDARWGHVGPTLTAFVDAARRAVDGSGSRLGSAESTPPVLRLRDLGRLAQMTVASHVPHTVEVGERLRSLQIATHQ